MAKSIYTDMDFQNTSKVVNLPNPTDPQDASTKGYVDSLVEGLGWKDNARVSTQGNINLSSPGGTIDAVIMVNGDRVVVRSQSTASQNGIYIWNGAASPMTRAADCSTATELKQAVVTVDEGTDAGATFRQTQVNFTLGTDPVVFTTFGTAAPAANETVAGIAEIATQAETDTGSDDTRTVTPLKLANWAGRARKHTQSFGDGSATQFTITHNFGTRDVHVEIYRNSGNYDTVVCDVERTSTNAVRLTAVPAVSSNALRAVIWG